MTENVSRPPSPHPSTLDLLAALVQVSRLPVVVPAALEIVERDPLTSAGCFRGDLLRGLMEVPGAFWGRYPDLHDRYLGALRAGAAARRRLAYDERMEFWSALDRTTLAAVRGGLTGLMGQPGVRCDRSLIGPEDD
jgi:hypothetical protein